VRIPVGGTIREYQQWLDENPETYRELMTGSFAADIYAAAARREQESVIAQLQRQMVRASGLPPRILAISTPDGGFFQTNWSYVTHEPRVELELETHPLPKELEDQPLLFMDDGDCANPRALYLQPMDEPGHYLVFLNGRLIPGVFCVEHYLEPELRIDLVGKPAPKQINRISVGKNRNGSISVNGRTGTTLRTSSWSLL
jgi:hypothetical protein